MSSRRPLLLLLASALPALAGPVAPDGGAPDLDPAAAFSTAKAPPLAIAKQAAVVKGAATLTDLTYAGATASDRLGATLVTPTSSSEKRHPAVLFVHWLGEPETTNRTEFLDEAQGLAARGVVSLLVDAQWSQHGWWKQRDFATDLPNSVRQVIELRRALDLLASRDDVDPKRIAYVGHDFGAMYGVLMGAADHRPMTYVLMAGTPRFSNWFLKLDAKRQPKDPQAYLRQIDPLDPVRYVSRLGGASVFFQFAEKDRFVPLAQAHEFADAAVEPKLLRTYPVDHQLNTKIGTSDRFRWLAKELELPK